MSEQEPPSPQTKPPSASIPGRWKLWWTIYLAGCLLSPFAQVFYSILHGDRFALLELTSPKFAPEYYARAIPNAVLSIIFLPVGLVYDYSLILDNLLNAGDATIRTIWRIDGWLFAAALIPSYWLFMRHRKLFVHATDRHVFHRLIWALVILITASLIGCAKMACDPNWDPMPRQM